MSNPESFSVTNSANLSPIIIAGTVGSKHIFANTDNRTINFPAVLFDTYALRLSIDEVISKIESLLYPIEGSDNPPLIGFRWGKTDYYPCYITEFSYTVTKLLGGSKAYLEADLTLTETNEITALNPEVQEFVDQQMTGSDKDEALEILKDDLEENPDILGFQGYSQYLSGQLDIEIDDTGIISTVLGEAKKRLGQFNIFDRIINYD